MNLIVPERCIFHCLALLPGGVEPHRFLTPLKKRRPGIRSKAESWTVVAKPRPAAFGPLIEGTWGWHVVIDLGSLPAAAWETGFGSGKPPAHGAHAFLFLLEAPRGSTGLERVRSTLEIAWAFLDAGAVALLAPSGGTLNQRKLIADYDPRELDAETATALLISYAAMGKGADGRYWIRTRGMSQFNLPDLCATLSGPPQQHQAEVERIQALFTTVAPTLIARDQPLREGETVEVGSRVWRAAGRQELQAAPPHSNRVQLFVHPDEPAALA